jgi:hypothetical protein
MMLAVRVRPPPEAVRVRLYVPAGVEAVVRMLSIAVPTDFSVNGFAEKPAVAPFGSPDKLKLTGAANPERVFKPIVYETPCPATTEAWGVVDNEKLGAVPTSRIRLTVRVIPTAVPVTIRLYLPAAV